MSTIIYGASDDLIEISGDVSEEFGADGGTNYIALSNGVLVSVKYDDEGMWRVRTIERPDGVECYLTEARGDGEPNDLDGCPGYSDKLVVEGVEAVWVLHGTEMAR